MFVLPDDEILTVFQLDMNFTCGLVVRSSRLLGHEEDRLGTSANTVNMLVHNVTGSLVGRELDSSPSKAYRHVVS